MNKSIMGLSGVLALSLIVNIWQAMHRADSNLAADLDPQAARKAPRTSSSGGGRGNVKVSNERFLRHGTGEVSASLKELLAIPGSMERYQAIISFVRGLPAERIAEAVEFVRENSGKKPDSEDRLLMELLLTRWGAEDPDAAFASLEGVGVKDGARDAVQMLSGLASADPARAAEWLAQDENRLTRHSWMAGWLARTIGREWSRRDPEAALRWASELTGSQRREALASVIGNVIDGDPAQALSVLNDLPPADRDSIIGEIAGELAQRSPAEALSWIESLEGPSRIEALGEVLESWAAAEPAQAASYLDRLESGERSNFVGEIGRQWASRDPVEAAQWLGSQDESSGRADAMGHVMWNWASDDPQAAADWLGQLPPGNSYDNGVAGFAKAATSAFSDGQAGVLWAATIENQQLRETMVGHTLRAWMREDQTAARAWATQNGFEFSESK